MENNLAMLCCGPQPCPCSGWYRPCHGCQQQAQACILHMHTVNTGHEKLPSQAIEPLAWGAAGVPEREAGSRRA